MTMLWCELALVRDQVESGVLIEVVDGRFSSIQTGADQGEATRLGGLTVPGLANAHSHAFHRALRARTQADRGTFWTWRTLMYRAAERLEPDSYHRLATAVFSEMAMAGVTCVGEFHYLHHQQGGTPYRNRNEMGQAVLDAADNVGIRITLLDTLYLHGGLDSNGYLDPDGVQRRFADRSADEWVERVDGLKPRATERVGAAIHSIRAVNPAAMTTVAAWAKQAEASVHAHVSEQPAENQACQSYHWVSPTTVLAESGLLNSRFTAVHATHVTDGDVATVADGGATVALCPTTERDLGDGIGPTTSLAAAGVPMALGSDSNAVIDLFEEARAVELNERLRSHNRGVFSAVELLAMASVNGHRSLGWPDAGAIAVGNRADLVTINLGSVRTAGSAPDVAAETAVFAAIAADVSSVHVDGRQIVVDGQHVSVDVAAELDRTIAEVMVDDR